MTVRESILQNIRANQPAARELPLVSAFHSAAPIDLRERFCASLKSMAGETITACPSDLGSFIASRFPGAKRICSAVPEFTGNCSPADFSNWGDAAGIDVTVVRSPLGVAETGSVLLSEKEFEVNSIGFLAHDIVILLDPENIVENIHDAYAHEYFRASGYCLLMTGPSGSGDIGAVIVHPAQASMTLTVIFAPLRNGHSQGEGAVM
jgi:L-lactate dehydrogenase complex protein LldG